MFRADLVVEKGFRSMFLHESSILVSITQKGACFAMDQDCVSYLLQQGEQRKKEMVSRESRWRKKEKQHKEESEMRAMKVPHAPGRPDDQQETKQQTSIP